MGWPRHVVTKVVCMDPGTSALLKKLCCTKCRIMSRSNVGHEVDSLIGKEVVSCQ